MVRVYQQDGSIFKHRDGDGWHIDENGLLHIRSEKGHVAAYAKGVWGSVETFVQSSNDQGETA